ncbi:MAG: hypothetical protein IPL70_11905 [Uliginosibacterium sp.]|nr:hypothetical protein [Uliginosibacterium sp.]
MQPRIGSIQGFAGMTQERRAHLILPPLLISRRRQQRLTEMERWTTAKGFISGHICAKQDLLQEIQILAHR